MLTVTPGKLKAARPLERSATFYEIRYRPSALQHWQSRPVFGFGRRSQRQRIERGRRALVSDRVVLTPRSGNERSDVWTWPSC
jgi:hypothetical protein